MLRGCCVVVRAGVHGSCAVMYLRMLCDVIVHSFCD